MPWRYATRSITTHWPRFHVGSAPVSRAAENIAYGYADFASTLKQWINSAGHRANLLLHGAKWIGVAHAQNGHRIYWAMVIGAK